MGNKQDLGQLRQRGKRRRLIDGTVHRAERDSKRSKDLALGAVNLARQVEEKNAMLTKQLAAANRRPWRRFWNWVKGLFRRKR